MHHYEHPDGHVEFNSDLSGEVKIVNSRGEEYWVSGVLLVNFVANYVEKYMLPRMREAKARFEAVSGGTIPSVVPDSVRQKLLKELEQLGDAEFAKVVACLGLTTPEVSSHSSK
jgi:anti-sigma factor ChrR (cupin superfamily)